MSCIWSAPGAAEHPATLKKFTLFDFLFTRTSTYSLFNAFRAGKLLIAEQKASLSKESLAAEGNPRGRASNIFSTRAESCSVVYSSLSVNCLLNKSNVAS